MDTIKQFRVVVIGAGVVGLGIARELSERGIRVALVDRGLVGGGTSANTFAWINATAKATDEAYFRLNQRGTEAYRSLAGQYGERRIGLHPTGMLEWASPDNDGRLEALRERADRLSSLGYPLAWVNRRQLVAMEPHVAFGENVEGLHAIADAWLDVPVYMAFGVERLAANSSQVFEHCKALELVVGEEGRVLGVVTSAGRFECEHVVVASGPDTPEVLSALTGYEGFSSRFPMQRAPGLLVKTPPEDHFHLAHHVLYDGDSGVHLRESADGGLLLGSDETDGLVEPDSPSERLREAARLLLERAGQLIPNFSGVESVAACELGVGVRAVPADDKSIVGPMPSSQGLHIALTHSGVTLSLELGRLLADTIEHGNVPEELAPFAITRFQGF